MRLSQRGFLAAAAALLASGGAIVAMPAVAAMAASHTAQPGAVMILVDVNRSPFVRQLSAERRTAVSYVNALPAGVEAGLIIFSNHWKLVLAPTDDRAKFGRALAGIANQGNSSTGLGQAIAGAATAVADSGATHDRLLVLSDGEDLSRPVAAGKIAIDVLTWTFDSDDNVAAVRAIAAATGGRVGDPARAAKLAAVMGQSSAPKPVPTRTVTAPTATAQAASPPSSAKAPPPWLLAVVFIAVFGLALMALGTLRPNDQGRRRLEQLAQYGPQQLPRAGASRTNDGKTASAAINIVGRLLQAGKAEPRLAARLDMAGISRRPAEWALLGLSGSVVLAAIVAAATGNLLIAVLVGVFGGYVGMRLLLSSRIARRRAAFAEQLPEMLQLVAGSLQAGFSLPQALDSVAREDTEPSSSEMARAVGEARIGVDLETALNAIADRMDNDDMRWTVMAIRIQRQVGGNLAEVLRNTAATMRERAYLRRQVRVLSGEGRLSAYILLALPILIGAWLFYTSPAYMRLLYTTSLGVVMLAGAGALFVIGAFWMRAVIKVEV